MEPLLYLSLFLKRHREEYHPRLTAVRRDGDWEGWLDFFLNGVVTIADEAVASARALFALIDMDRKHVLATEGTSVYALRIFELLPRHPVVSVASVMKRSKTTKPSAASGFPFDEEILAYVGVENEFESVNARLPDVTRPICRGSGMGEENERNSHHDNK